MMHFRKHHRFPLLLSLFLALLMTVAASGSLLAQTPQSCKISGLLSYSVVVTYDAQTDRTTYDFTFYNNSPVFDDPPGIFLYANVGRFFIFGLGDALSTQQPVGYVFQEVGQNHSWESTANPWWSFPPSIPPGGSLSGFQYVISGTPKTITDVVDQFEGVDPSDPTWQTPGPQGGFDCATLREIANPCVEITKDPDVDSAQVGDTITYKYEVCNCGDVTITVTSITDDNPDVGNLLDEFLAENGNSAELDPDECVEFEAEYVVQAGDPNPLENCVEVVAEYSGTEIDDEACASVTIEGQELCISIDKTADPTSVVAGDTVTYKYKVCNCSDVTLTVTSLEDDNPDIGDLLDEFFAANNDSYDLEPDECVEFEANYTTDSGDVGTLENCAEVEAEDDAENEVTDSDCAEVEVAEPNPDLDVTKTVDPTTASVGQKVTYHYRLCNTGNVDLEITQYLDSIPSIGNLLDEFFAANGDSYILEVGDCVNFDVDYIIKYKYPDPLENCVNVTGEYDGTNVTDEDCATVDIEDKPNPRLKIIKTVDPTTAVVGDEVTYSYRLCNTGNRDLDITRFQDSIPSIGDLLDEFFTANDNSYILEINDCVDFNVQYTVNKEDVPFLKNCVEVVGRIPSTTDTVEDQDCAFLTVNEDVITRQCFVPVTFTVDGWARFCCPFRPIGVAQYGTNCIGDPLIPEGMVYSRFPIAFECFRFFGEEFPNRLVLGDDVRLEYIGKTSCLDNLCKLFKRNCYGCGPLKLSLDCPWEFTYETGGGCLAVETIALLMNIAYNDMRLMPKTPGVDLECYTLVDGPLEGKTVGQVLFIANEILGGRAPQQFGLIDCFQLVDILRKINENYEFEDFDTSNDRGFLIPDKPFGQPDPPHCPEVKDYSKDCIIGPCIRVIKTANPAIARPGDTITYKFVVKNCGPEALTGVTVTDDLLGDLTALFVTANDGSPDLAIGECVEFSIDAVIPLTDAKSICNTVTVTAAGLDTAVEDTDIAIVGILQDNPTRQCFLPTTFTAEGWAFFCDPNNGIIPGGMVYTRFPQVFKCFQFFGKDRPNELLVGGKDIFIRYIGKTSCLERLCLLLGSDCDGCGKLRYPIDCPWRLTDSEGGGCLAVETITLLLNVAYNDMRLMPRTKGVDLECYKLAAGPLKGKTVAEVFNIANELLSGKPPCMFGLSSCAQLVFVLRQINANYEFVDFDTFNDHGFLIPNKLYDPFDKPHCPTVPMQCKARKW